MILHNKKDWSKAKTKWYFCKRVFVRIKKSINSQNVDNILKVSLSEVFDYEKQTPSEPCFRDFQWILRICGSQNRTYLLFPWKSTSTKCWTAGMYIQYMPNLINLIKSNLILLFSARYIFYIGNQSIFWKIWVLQYIFEGLLRWLAWLI